MSQQRRVNRALGSESQTQRIIGCPRLQGGQGQGQGQGETRTPQGCPGRGVSQALGSDLMHSVLFL